MASGDVILSAGTQTAVITGASTRASGAFSSETSALTSNTYKAAEAVLSVSFTTAPSVGGLINVYRRDLNVQGTNDTAIPDSSYKPLYMGSFVVDNSTSQQYITMAGNIPLRYGDQEFYLENGCDQTMDSDYVLYLTAISDNVEA